jgi:hypothetical protein
VLLTGKVTAVSTEGANRGVEPFLELAGTSKVRVTVTVDPSSPLLKTVMKGQSVELRAFWNGFEQGKVNVSTPILIRTK